MRNPDAGIIRLASEDDAGAVLGIYAPFCERTAVSFETEAPALEEIRRRIRTTRGRWPWLICESGGEATGYAYAGPHRDRAAYRWSADVTVYVAEGRRRSGVGRALYTTLARLLALQGYYGAFAGITLPNPASVGLHEALGFRPVGVYRDVGYKLGSWHDVGWWRLALQPPTPEPPEPRPLAAVIGTPEWHEALSSGGPFLRPRPLDSSGEDPGPGPPSSPSHPPGR